MPVAELESVRPDRKFPVILIMQDDFRHTADEAYIQNEGDSSSRSTPVEISANVTEAFPEVSEQAICIRMLDPQATSHRKSHIGVIISPEVAREFAHWLLEAADSPDGFMIVDPPE